MRIEDLDAERCPRERAESILSTLDALGLKSDEEPLFQSERTAFYQKKEAELLQRARVYPCFCSRAQLHAAEAPRADSGEPIYSGACRNLGESQIRERSVLRRPCLRLEVPDEEISFQDGLAGTTVQNLKRDCGDFILRRSDGVYAYQFAVSADDGESGVTEVVRGNDLLSSTPRQIYVMRLLGYRPPAYYHIPLVCDKSGRKLSKSEGDSAARLLESYPPDRILGFLAYSAGLLAENRPATLKELVSIFRWENVKRDTVYLDTDSLR